MSLSTQRLHGAEIRSVLDTMAELRIRVFHDWPYLYAGTREYESGYLQMYLDCPDSLAVLVWDGQHCVGASTLLPLRAAPIDIQQPFIDAAINLERIAYFGESVVLPEYRGKGIGVQFFELREEHARRLELTRCVFCAVDRPAADARKPASYVPNDAFWSRRGYRKCPELRTELHWPDIGEDESSAKTMIFWQRDL